MATNNNDKKNTFVEGIKRGAGCAIGAGLVVGTGTLGGVGLSYDFDDIYPSKDSKDLVQNGSNIYINIGRSCSNHGSKKQLWWYSAFKRFRYAP